jgi:uncharacterized RDD family membrane protein YckC
MNASTDSIPLYAGFWRRGAAMFLDALVLVIPGLVISYFLGERQTLVLLVGVLVAVAYYAGFHSSERQATPGKRAFGSKVTNYEGERISLGRGIWRYFATWLSALVFFIGYLLAAFTSKKQALHDMAAGTVVVNAAAAHEDVAGANGGAMPVTIGVVLMNALFLLLPIGGMFTSVAIPYFSR